ncbi:hypothetical protein BDR07DRAFT_1381557 [Suillus spraguei]|nr:hypothetical protein BDR07DRAFT_1381557 [Suillus spraguei]
MVPNGTGPRWDYLRDISMVPNRPRPRWDYLRDISMVPNRPRPRWDYTSTSMGLCKEYIMVQIELDLDGTIPRPRWDYLRDISMVPNRPRPRWDYRIYIWSYMGSHSPIEVHGMSYAIIYGTL